MSGRPIVVATLALVAAGASAAAAQEPMPRRQAEVRTDTFTVSGTPFEAEAGRFIVPAVRGAEPGATLSLGYVRFRSTATAPAAPIVFLAGGPGDAATRALRGMPLPLLRRLLEIADVVAFDQRGTGISEPREPICPPSPFLPRDVPGAPDVHLALLRRHVAACLDSAAANGVPIAGLTTAESADDLAALRAALGTERLTLLAGSYGTHLALAAARRHPSLIERMVLVGVEGPDDTFKLPSRVDEVLGAVAAARRPALLDEVRTLRARLGATPVRYAFPGGQVMMLGEWDLQRWIAGSLDAVPAIETMLAAMPRLLEGDYSPLARAALRERLPRRINLMKLAMDCASFASPYRLERIRREAGSTVLGDAIDFPLPALCDLPALPRLPDAFRAPLRSDVPALLVAGSFDGRTPPPNAHHVARGMPHARVLVVEGASHALFGVPDVQAAMLEFLAGNAHER